MARGRPVAAGYHGDVRTLGKFGATVELSPNFMDIWPHSGQLLLYLAEECIKRISVRTDQGRNVDGSWFREYKPRYLYESAEDGAKPAHDAATGRWIQIRGPSDKVTLRSQQDVAPGKRMRDWLRVVPRVPAPRASEVRIVPRGGRKSPGAGHVGHVLRAATCGKTGRWWIGIAPDVWSSIVGSVRREFVLAFIQHRNAAVMAEYRRKAERRLKIQRNRTLRAQKAAQRTAEQEHRAQVQRQRRAMQRVKKLSGESARDAQKRISRQSRIDRAARAADQKRRREWNRRNS